MFPVEWLTISALEMLVTECQQRNDYLPLVRQIGQIFSSSETLNASFLRDDVCAGSSSFGDTDDMTVDIAAVRHAYKLLFGVKQSNLEAALVNAMLMMSDNVHFDVGQKRNLDSPNYCNQFVICMENPELLSPEYIDSAFPKFLAALARLPEKQQQKLILYWSHESPEQLQQYVQCLHQLITVKVIEGQFSERSRSLVNDNQGIVAAVQIMNMIYLASLLGGLRREHENSMFPVGPVAALGDVADSSSSAVAAAAEAVKGASSDEDIIVYPMGLFGPAVRQKQQSQRSMKIEDFDQLYKMFGRFSWDCRHPLLEHEEFYNDSLDDAIQLDQDFVFFKVEDRRPSFLNYPFVLRPATKVMGLFYDSRIRMHRERRHALLHMLTTGDENMPYLKLVVRRDFMIDDALVQVMN